MASQAQQMSDLNARISVIEDRLKIDPNKHVVRNIFISVLLTAAVSGLAWWGWYVTTNIISIKQALVSNGTALVAQLKSPASPQQLEASLSTVIAQVQTAQANGTKPDRAKVQKISKAVSEVVTRDPDLNEGWRAAGLLVSYLSPEAPHTEERCGKDNGKLLSETRNGITIVSAWHDCVMYLDDSKDLDFAAMAYSGNIPPTIVWRLERVRVIYKGGNLPKVNEIEFSNCTFDFSLPSAPPSWGRSMTTQLLASQDINKVTVTTHA